MLQPGEERVEATFLGIECASGRNIARFTRADDKSSLLLWVPDLGKVDFIVYRQDLAGGVTCGERSSPELVLVTFTPGSTAGGGTTG